MKRLGIIFSCALLIFLLCSCESSVDSTVTENTLEANDAVDVEDTTNTAPSEDADSPAYDTTPAEDTAEEPEDSNDADDVNEPEDEAEPEDNTESQEAAAAPAPETQNNTASPSSGTVPQQTTTPSAEPEPSTPSEPEPQEVEADLKSIAEGYMDQSVSSLYAAIGKPTSSDYAPSCLGDGDDGELYYNGFVVYTYREGESETVIYVE